MNEVREKNTCVLACTFRDENGNPVTPDSAAYRIDDIKESGDTPIVALTLFTPPDIEVDAADNRILDPARNTELRRVTITWTYGSGKAGADEFDYLVRNLSKVS